MNKIGVGSHGYFSSLSSGPRFASACFTTLQRAAERRAAVSQRRFALWAGRYHRQPLGHAPPRDFRPI
jgi:hypothetical protein